MSTESNEQFRAGFEAWAEKRGLTLDRDGFDYQAHRTSVAWGAWIEAKREASTEPSAIRDAALEEAAKAAEGSEVATMLVRGQVWDDGVLTRDNIASAIRALKSGAGALPDEAKDAEILRWRIANHRWSARWRLHRATQAEQWQMIDDGEPWGQWGEFRAIHEAAMKAHPGIAAHKGQAPHAAAETMDHDQLGKLGQHYANGK